jgi:hypothetical protein
MTFPEKKLHWNVCKVKKRKYLLAIHLNVTKLY